MAQTTASIPQACGMLEITRTLTCDAGWVDISGSSQSLSGVDVTRMSGEAYTFTGDGPIIQGGKREPVEIVVVVVYSEVDTEAFDRVRAAFIAAGCGAHMCLRWSPGGGDPGDALYTTGPGFLVSFTYPPMDASTGGPILAGFTLKIANITTSNVAPS